MRGTPKVGAICPPAAKIYLNSVDKVFKRERIGNISKASIHLVQYAEDMIIHAQKNLKKGIDLLEHYTQRLGIGLDQEKIRRLELSISRSCIVLLFL